MHNLDHFVIGKNVQTLHHIEAIIVAIDRNAISRRHPFLEHLLIHFEEAHMRIDVGLLRFPVVVVEATIDGEFGLRRVRPIERLFSITGITKEVQIKLQLVHHHLHLGL